MGGGHECESLLSKTSERAHRHISLTRAQVKDLDAFEIQQLANPLLLSVGDPLACALQLGQAHGV